MNVTSFSVFQTCIQSGNIHYIKLDVYAQKQSMTNPSFISSQHKQGRKYNTLTSSPLQLVRTGMIHVLMKLRHLIHTLTANGLRNACGPVQTSAHYMNA